MIAAPTGPRRLRPADLQQLEAAQSALRTGRVDDALSRLHSLQVRNPSHVTVLANLAMAQRRAGDAAAALATFALALRQPDAPAELWFNHANLLRDLGRSGDAERAYRKAVVLRPTLHQANTNLANLLSSQKQPAQAESLHRTAVTAQPASLPSLRALARLRFEANDFQESGKFFRAALQLAPGHAETQLGLGVALKELGRTDEAIALWQDLLRRHPDFAAAHNNLGALMRLVRRPGEAVGHLRTALRLAPRDAMAAANLAHALIDLGQIGEADSVARGIVDRDPSDAQGHLMLGFAQTYQGRVEQGLDSFQRAHRCMPESALVISNTLFASQYSASLDGAAVLALHRQLACRIAPALPTRTHRAHERDAQRRLRIGYLSPDLRSHPVSTFFEPVLAHHDPRLIETYCYSTTQAPDATTQRLQSLAAHWRDCPTWSDALLAEAITADSIDILVDLAGHTAQNRAAVVRARPAPVQVLYIGYPGTSGLPETDYLIADARVCPPGSEHLYTERIVRLDGSFWCYGGPSQAPLPAPAPCHVNGFISFGSFNALQKMSDTVVACWARVLQAVPRSRLVLKSLAFADAGTGEAVRRRFAALGISGERVDVFPPSDNHALMTDYRLLDIALDPFPYNGGTTTCDAMWMGVPVVTLAGERFCGRMGTSLLHSVGLDEFVASTTDSDVGIATGLALDPERLANLRNSLRDRIGGSALGNGAMTTRELKYVYDRMWREWVGNQEQGDAMP